MTVVKRIGWIIYSLFAKFIIKLFILFIKNDGKDSVPIVHIVCFYQSY